MTSLDLIRRAIDAIVQSFRIWVLDLYFKILFKFTLSEVEGQNFKWDCICMKFTIFVIILTSKKTNTMKKLLLLLVAAFLVFGASAQNAAQKSKVDAQLKVLDSEYQVTNLSPRTMPPIVNNDSKAMAADITKIPVGVAHSQRSFRREGYRVLSYNKDLDLISLSFVLREEAYPGVALSDGSVGIFYSEDHGMTWNGPVLISDLSADEKRNYYQTGIIYNPSGNTEVANAYGVFQGAAPDNPGGTLGDWDNQAFGASTFGGANYSTVFYENTHPYDGYYNTFGLSQKGDIIKCINLITTGDWGAFESISVEDITGNYNGTGFDWVMEEPPIPVPFALNVNVVEWRSMWTSSDEATGIAWSDDGMIGYAWLVGANENEETGYWPIVFRTDNGGGSWDEIELDFLDDVIQEAFSRGEEDPLLWEIYPCQNTAEEYLDFAIPWFRATDGAVDAAGNLQLVGHVKGHSRDFISGDNYEFNNENLGWSYNSAGSIYKFTIGEELIDAMSVDTLMTNAAQSLADPGDSLYCTTDGWLHRLYISKDERSEEFFVTWNDSPEGDRVRPNYQPDLKGWSYNIVTGVNTDAVCFSCGQTFPFEHYWYTSAAEYAYYNADDETFTVPVVSGVSVNDFYVNTSASGDSVHVEYITGITFPAIVPIPVSVDELSATSNTSVSQNLPNPATGITTIEISSETVAPVTVEISNIIGQTVHTTDAGIINGNMSVNIDVSNLEAGVYLYTVTIANERVSKRMIVR